MSTTRLELAKHFWVDDVPGAATAGTRLNNILESLAGDQRLAQASMQFLTTRGLLTLVSLANGECKQEEFNQLARAERNLRISATLAQQQAAKAQRQTDRAAADAREADMWARLASERLKRESDPKWVAIREARDLRLKYAVEFVEEENDFKRLMAILRKIDSGSRLPEEDAVWLSGEGREYATNEMLSAHNRLEADFYIAEYKRTGDVWQAVNASGHLRKCGSSDEAHELLVAIPDSRIKQNKLKSAVLTTHGGAMRDLGRVSEALKFGEKAHLLLPGSFRPCTLMGALNIELGNVEAGHEWYRKAEERGAATDSIVSELRSVLARMSVEKREEVISQLLRIDPGRYSSVRRKSSGKGY